MENTLLNDYQGNITCFRPPEIAHYFLSPKEQEDGKEERQKKGQKEEIVETIQVLHSSFTPVAGPPFSSRSLILSGPEKPQEVKISFGSLWFLAGVPFRVGIQPSLYMN